MKKYQCVCGTLFDNAQKFNGHKGHCKIHQLQKYGNLDKYNEHISKWVNAGIESTLNKQQLSKINNKNKLDQWLLEQHKCKTCNGSGIYCSRTCANKRNLSDKTKQKISSTIKNNITHTTRTTHTTCIVHKYCLDCSKILKASNKSGYCINCYKHHKVISESTRQKLREAAIKR